MHIRLAVPADAPVLAAAEAATAATPGLLVQWPGDIPVSDFTDKIVKLSTHGRYLVAEDAGAVVGHAMLDPLSLRMHAVRHVFLLSITVHPGHLERGIGTTLLRDLLDWARGDARVGKVELKVRAGNLRAQHLYRKFGFIEEARFKRRVLRSDGRYEDDIGMAWFPHPG